MVISIDQAREMLLYGNKALKTMRRGIGMKTIRGGELTDQNTIKNFLKTTGILKFPCYVMIKNKWSSYHPVLMNSYDAKYVHSYIEIQSEAYVTIESLDQNSYVQVPVSIIEELIVPENLSVKF